MTTLSHPASVVIVVPIYRDTFSDDERLSLRHLETFLGDYDHVFLVPERLADAPIFRDYPAFDVISFSDDSFNSIEAYSQLLLSASFYRAFDHRAFMLIAQLDSLVFSDALPRWCEAGYDYIGAPWLIDPASPEKGFSRVGNGGFSLRRTETFLRVLESERYLSLQVSGARDLFTAPLPDVASHRWLKRARILRAARRGAAAYAKEYSLNEDRFWSDRARLFLPELKIAPASEALDFAFERAPRYCLARNANKLPFGCHAWSRWDRAFWEPYLLDR